jgi:hypothetical protein
MIYYHFTSSISGCQNLQIADLHIFSLFSGEPLVAEVVHAFFPLCGRFRLQSSGRLHLHGHRVATRTSHQGGFLQGKGKQSHPQTADAFLFTNTLWWKGIFLRLCICILFLNKRACYIQKYNVTHTAFLARRDAF